MSNETAALKKELEQIQLAYQMAAQMSQFKAGFLARTAHELRSPLSSLMGMHQLILCDLCNSPEEEREFLAQAYQSAQKLMNIIDEIIDISRMEFGTHQVEIQPLGLASVFAEVYRLTHLQAANRNLQLKIASTSPELHIMADRKQLLQVLVNLIDIAILYPEENQITLSASSSESSKLAHINVDLQCPVDLLSEPVNLLQQIPEPTPEATKMFGQKLELSPGMKVWLAQTMLEVMQGDLNVLEMTRKDGEPFTRLQCSLPCLRAGTAQKT